MDPVPCTITPPPSPPTKIYARSSLRPGTILGIELVIIVINVIIEIVNSSIHVHLQKELNILTAIPQPQPPLKP